MDASPFRLLSAELRNRIYELVLTSTKGITVDCSGTKSDFTNNGQNATFEYPDLSLTQTCKQIRQESLNMYYFINPLTILTSVSEDDSGNIKFPLGGVRSNINAFRRVIGKQQFAMFRHVSLVICSRERLAAESPRLRFSYTYTLDRDMVHGIRGCFSTTCKFEVRFESMSKFSTWGCPFDLCLNALWDVDQADDVFLERLVKLRIADAKSAKGMGRRERMVRDLRQTLATIVMDLVRCGFARCIAPF